MKNEHQPTTNTSEIVAKVFTPASIKVVYETEQDGAEVVSLLEGSPTREAELGLARARIADRAIAMAMSPNTDMQVVMAEQQVDIVLDTIEETPGVAAPAVPLHEAAQVVAEVLEYNKDFIKEQLDPVVQEKLAASTAEVIMLRSQVARRDEKIEELSQHPDKRAEALRGALNHMRTEVADLKDNNDLLVEDNAALQAALAQKDRQLQEYRALVMPDDVLRDAELRDREAQIRALETELSTARHEVIQLKQENGPAARLKRLAANLGRRASAGAQSARVGMRQASNALLNDNTAVIAAQGE